MSDHSSTTNATRRSLLARAPVLMAAVAIAAGAQTAPAPAAGPRRRWQG